LLAFLEGLRYPLLFLDFETFSIPIPPYEGLRPYSQVPFQFSLHKRQAAGSELEHIDFIAPPGVNPRPEFLSELLKASEGQGSLIVYNATFERGVLLSLVESFPAFRLELEGRIERMIDLLDPFRQRMYYDPEMGGSFSLKNVLPVLVPGLSYDRLEVQDGTQAMDTYLKLSGLEPEEELRSTLGALRDYCRRDTLAMVRILEALEGAVHPG
jgi:hypothetical protein